MSQDMYAGYFGLSRRPFTLVPDPDLLFWSPQHKRAFAVLEYGVMSRAPITLITGEVGAGKTTLLHALLGRMTSDLRVGLVANAQGDRGELLQWAMNALGMDLHEGESYVQMFRRLQDLLVADYAAGRRVVLIFDEAQNLSKAGLEELRMLTNINSNQDELVQLILVGQPDLRRMVTDTDMHQLAQRVAANFHLDALDRQSTVAFIVHRLKLAGGCGAEIDLTAAEMAHDITGGVPRLINQLCDLAMLYAWSDTEAVVGTSVMERVLDDGVFFGGGLMECEAG
ncbi:type II secretory pathway predicted ATPase ExeA [Aliiruegeria haliotis]|uniref:Type II secretory pathway predicted ATPase ExeA n=1 Tax=Aliiruegeria haliotis TaxID=1280846 RepID=A0A2T0RSR0_9RHOB|nr:AAA family ATPase [Aliiruegeria haliotis]PRY24235.1 type II secretory pathway predicted ATPase ExeA [Aliiruegeria haliotis]